MKPDAKDPGLLDRRTALAVGASSLAFAAHAQDDTVGNNSSTGRVTGHPLAGITGEEVFKQGGNVYDAIVAAAFVASVAAPYQCGPAGYGGSFIGSNGQVIDFNSTAPEAAREGMFPSDEQGQVIGNVNTHGWLSAGVPGILSGLELVLKKYGTWKLSAVLQPAIALARDGIKVDASLISAIRSAKPNFVKDPASAEIYLPNGEIPKPGTVLKNQDLARLLASLAAAETTQDFYNGDAAKRIAAAFRSNGGLVNEQDLAAYQPLEPAPAQRTFGQMSIATPPPTAGGVTVLQALAVLERLIDRSLLHADNDSAMTRALLESLLLCWDDRLHLLGDNRIPGTAGAIPWTDLFDETRLAKHGAAVEKSLREGVPVDARSDGRTAGGTIHLSAADARGNFAALTLTHGGGFGAQVTVPGLGVTLGHGMSRFDPRPGHPNSPGPGKRPLHNMCASIIYNNGMPIAAIGGRGGRRIPSAIVGVLTNYLFRHQLLNDAITGPRLHTEGDRSVWMDSSWPVERVREIEQAGYSVQRSAIAVVSSVWRDSKGHLEAHTR